MKIEWFVLIAIILPSVLAIQCTIRQNSCNTGEICLFSRYQANNTHVGNCTAYGNLTCCSDPYLARAQIKASCNLGENGTISLYNYTNSHAEIYTQGTYNYKVCVDCPWICTLRASCLSDEYAIASINASTNAHIGEPGFYANQVCCKNENVQPTYSNLGENATVIDYNRAVKLYTLWQDNGNISHAILETNETGVWQNKSIYGSPLSIRANSGWSNFTWQNSSFSDILIGWRIYANDTCGNWHVTPITTFRVNSINLNQCQNITSSGSYILTTDVSAVGTCFNITAVNVTLNCNKKSISYAISTIGYGVYIKSNNVTITNCTIIESGSSLNDDSYAIYVLSNYTKIIDNSISTDGVFDGASIHGIYLYNANNNTISKNNISVAGGLYGGYGIFLDSSSKNNITYNNINSSDNLAIYVSGSTMQHFDNYIDTTNTEFGKTIYYYFNQSDIKIENKDAGEIFFAYSNKTIVNNVTLDKDGIILYKTNNSIINSSVIKTDKNIYIESGNNITLINNIIRNFFSNVVYFNGSRIIILANNNITCHTSLNERCIYFSFSNNNTIINNNITDYYSEGNVIFLSNSVNNTLNNNNITVFGSGSYGILFQGSNNTLISKTNLNATGVSYGVYINWKSFNISIINSTLNSTFSDISFNGNSSVQIINTTFNKSSVRWLSQSNAWINVSYYVDVYVRNSTGSVDSAQVNMTNYTNSLVFSGQTNSNGYTTIVLLPEFFANGSYSYSCPSSQANLSCASPYNFSASKGSLFNSTIEYVNQSKTIQIYFEKILSVTLSNRLSEGIFFTNSVGSQTNTQGDIDITRWNNGTWNYNNTPQPGNLKTLYWVYNSGNTPQDICLKANADLTCSQGACATNTISVTNIAYTNSTYNNATHPVYATTNTLSLSYVKVAENVQPGQYYYFRFWLYGPIGKPSGIYNTTFSVRNVESGSSCN
ncbi:MAG: right-handed parallel beta-helix repeat-containing protein [Candidatus Aenigmatarchaeota archaeon]|nr:right-handed parallel beta-helix repeat-containing protein [Candidatus Aenigmarchaeota archaeon]